MMVLDVMVHLLWLKSLTAQETKQSLQPNGRDGAILRNDIRRHLPDDVVAVRSQITEGVVGRNTHAEEPLVNYCKANNLSINKLAAPRGVCKDVC